MIEPKKERLIRAADVPSIAWLPPRPGGKPLSISTVYAWMDKGIRGIKLEHLQAGGVMCTSEEAVSRFFAALSTPPSEPSKPKADPKAHDRAKAILDRAGI